MREAKYLKVLDVCMWSLDWPQVGKPAQPTASAADYADCMMPIIVSCATWTSSLASLSNLRP